MNAWSAADVSTMGTPSGSELLDDIETFVSRFVVYPGEAERIAHVLWIGHAWFMDQWESTPRIAFLSPEPGSGKSRALEVTEPLVPRALHAINVSPTYLFRKVGDEAGPPTVLFDEIDTVFGPKARENEELRGLLNAGHRKGAFAGRCVVRGKSVETEDFPAYCAVALAGLDDLPDTIMSRSVVVRMRRRAPGESVEPWRIRVQRAAADALNVRLMEWSNQHQHTINTWPEMPEGVEDRNADVWEALIAVADLAGGEWPTRARVSAVTLVTHSRDAKTSLGVLLLRDLREIFTKRQAERFSTKDILDELHAIEESPWDDLRGKPLDARGLSNKLRRYDIKPGPVRIGEEIVKGYKVEELRDAWIRYLPAPVPSENSVTSVTGLQDCMPVTEVTDESSDARRREFA